MFIFNVPILQRRDNDLQLPCHHAKYRNGHSCISAEPLITLAISTLLTQDSCILVCSFNFQMQIPFKEAFSVKYVQESRKSISKLV